MAKIGEITALCREGKIEEAEMLASEDFELNPEDAWNHRKVAWAVYYKLKNRGVENFSREDILTSIEKVKSLEKLEAGGINGNSNAIFFDMFLWKIGEYIKKCLPETDFNSFSFMSQVFALLNDYDFESSKGYSFLLQNTLKFNGWNELADFIDWWNLDKLSQEDYDEFVMQNGRKLMSLAERAYIAQSKALLTLNNRERIESYLPKLEALMDGHPEMLYPGYFYGKMLLALGSGIEEELKVIVPFVRKKKSEFWAWQLLSDVFTNDTEKQIACLLKAISCQRNESFLGKVRIKLASIYIRQRNYASARYHTDIIIQNYVSQGWKLPREVEDWMHEGFLQNVQPNDDAGMDFSAITNRILCEDTQESLAIVTYVDAKNHKASIIYGLRQRTSTKLKIKTGPGAVLKINYLSNPDGSIDIINAEKGAFQENLQYAKVVTGNVTKRTEWQFAFLKSGDIKCFIAPNIVSKYNVSDGEQIMSLIVYDYDKKKNSWNWVCLSVKR